MKKTILNAMLVMVIAITTNCSKNYDQNADVTDALFKLHTDYDPKNPVSKVKWSSDISKEWKGKSAKVKCKVDHLWEDYVSCDELDLVKNVEADDERETTLFVGGSKDMIKELQQQKEYTFGCTVKYLNKDDEFPYSRDPNRFIGGSFQISLENCIIM